MTESEREAMRLYELLIVAGIHACMSLQFCRYSSGLTDGPRLTLQAPTQALASSIRALLPGVTLWSNNYDAKLSWWEYNGVTEGVHIHIYAVNEAPPLCIKVEEEITEEIDVPVSFEKQTITRKVVRWECGEAAHA